jgi:hypothetical protein
MNITNTLLTFLFLLFSTSLYGQTFGAEQNFAKQILLPDSVYKTLLKDNDVNDILKSARKGGKSIKSIKKQFFQAAHVYINDDKLPDLLVKGQSYLAGTNTTHFWVFKQTSKGYVQVFETATFSLSLLKKKTKGHRIIRSSYPSGAKAVTDYFRFDGSKYIHSWSKEETI